MYPELIKIGDFVISSFGALVAVAFIASYWVSLIEFRRKGLSEELHGNLFLASMIGGIVGAKLLYLFENVPLSAILSDPISHIFSRGGLTFYGGLIGATVLFLIVARKYKASIWEIGDATAPALALGYAIGRIGCFLVGDDYGIKSDVPWAMAFPNGLPPTLDRVHPTQLYEIILMFIIFLILWKTRKRFTVTGAVFSIYLILSGSERFFIEFVRNTTPSPISGLSIAQVIASLLIIVGVYKLIKLRNVGNLKS